MTDDENNQCKDVHEEVAKSDARNKSLAYINALQALGIVFAPDLCISLRQIFKLWRDGTQ